MKPLEWYGKRFSSGDMDGDGTLKLLRGANIPPQALLVRETAQNSWDARLEGSNPSITYHGFELGQEQYRTLKEIVFHDVRSSPTLVALLDEEAPPPAVLEIADRGTSGLGGPIRNDLVFSEGEPTDWVDFVLTLGARQDTVLGGGTFGFGKVITYLASSAHTIIIWSRAEVNGQVCSRLIASAMGESFHLGSQRYTGRQWWGRCNEDRIEPVEGPEADQLGQILFSQKFGARETGTSLLILGPNLSDSLESLMRDISKAVLWNLWPKLIPDSTGEHSMPISVLHNSQPVTIPDPLTHPILSGFAESLSLVRETQSNSQQHIERPLSTIREIRSQRPIALLGHLAITTLPDLSKASHSEEDHSHEDDPLVPIAGNASHIALMRNVTELVVTYRAMPGETGFGHRCGVFKCSADVDNSFARSEPPAHDKWEPAEMDDKIQKRHVNIALTKMKDQWRELTSSQSTAPKAEASAFSTAGLANELADLVPGLGGTRAAAFETSKQAKRRRKRRRKGHNNTSASSDSTSTETTGGISNSLKLVAHDVVATSPTSRLAVAHIHVHGPPAGLAVIADIAAAFDGGDDSEVAANYVQSAAWYKGHLEPSKLSIPKEICTEVAIQNEEANWTLAIWFDDRVSLSLNFRQRRAK